MLKTGPARKVTIYVGQDHQYHGEAVYAAILQFLFYHQVSGASVTRGIEGYGASTLIRRPRRMSFSHDAPVIVSVIDSEEKLQKLLPFLDEMVDEGLIATSTVEVIKYVHQDGLRS